MDPDTENLNFLKNHEESCNRWMKLKRGDANLVFPKIKNRSIDNKNI